MPRILEPVVSQYRRRSESSFLFRRQLLAMLVIAGAGGVVRGDEATGPIELTPPLNSKVQIRVATRPWTDSEPEKYQPMLRFRSPQVNANEPAASQPRLRTPDDLDPGDDAPSITTPSSIASSPKSTTPAPKLATPPASVPMVAKPLQSTVTPAPVLGPVASDNWVARDAMNARTPLSDPPSTTNREANPATGPAIKSPTGSPQASLSPLQLVRPQDVTSLRTLGEDEDFVELKGAPASISEANRSGLDNTDDWDARDSSLPASPEPAPRSTSRNSSSSTPAVESAEIRLAPESSVPVGSGLRDAEGPRMRDLDEADLDEPNLTSANPDPVTSEAMDESLDAEGTDADTEVETQEATTGSSRSETSTSRSGMQVRRLQIDRDGSPAEEAARRSQEGDNEPSEEVIIEEGNDSQSPAMEEEPTLEVEPLRIGDDSVDEPTQAASELDYTGRPKSDIQINATVQRLQPTIRACLTYYHNKPENASTRSNWGMLHQIMIYGADTNIIAGRKTYNAIAWMAGNNACRGQRMLGVGPRGIEAKSGVGLQGHQAQMLAVFSICDVPATYPLYVSGKRYSVQNLIDREASLCKSGEELTFTLIALSHYWDTDKSWKGVGGETWDFERLIREELSQPIVGAACGGTHRLMGFSHALRNRRAEGKPITGQWLRAEKFIDDFVNYAYQLQNRDGSFSTAWFEDRQDNGDVDRKVQTTGHIVEWLLTTTADEDLQDPRLVSAVRFLANSLNSDRTHDWAVGPKGHALRSLAMYYDRVYDAGPAWRSSPGVARGTVPARR